MKKLILITLLFAACKSGNNYNGYYVTHIAGQFSIADDTLIIIDTVVTNNTGFQKIRNGKLLPKGFTTRTWTLNSPDAPPMQIRSDQIQIGKTIYYKLP
jgi:hypothetical protein